MSVTTCIATHLSAKSPIAAYRAELAEDVAELVDGGMSTEAAWLKVAGDKLTELKAERTRIEQVVADAYAKTAAGKVEVPAKPEVAAQAPQAAATHADPGEAPEAVTPAVVAEAVKTAAENRDRKPSEMKRELLRMIDEAMANAKADDDQDVIVYMQRDRVRVDKKALDRRRLTGKMRDLAEQEIQSRINAERQKAADNIGFVTLKVPGDGTFKVLNAKDKLAEFRSKVESSPGFKDRQAAPRLTDAGDGDQRGSGGPKNVIVNMIDENDPQAAVDYAAARGLDIAEVLKGDKVRLPKVAGLMPTEAEAVGEFEPEAQAEAQPEQPPAEDDEAPKLTEAQARKQFEWRDMGQKDGTKTHRLFFFVKPEDKGTGAAMGRGYVELYEGSSGWRVDGEGESFKALADAKKAAVEAAIPVLREQGWIEPAAETAAQPVAETKPKPGAILDFGQKLEGARKDYAATLKDAADVDVAAEPLSKSWPEPNYQKLLDGGADPVMVAFIRAARDEVPTKPQRSWKLKTWAETVKVLRDMATSMLDGKIDRLRLLTALNDPKLANVGRGVGGRAELYEAVGHDKSLKGITLQWHHYGLYKGQKDVSKWAVEQQAKASAYSNWPSELAVADTKAEAIAQFKAKIASLETGPKASGKPPYIIWSKRGQPGAFVGKKIGREYVVLKRTDDIAQARKFMAENTAELDAALEKYKETPYERKTENAPRVGDSHRNGAPVTPKIFEETFGFRGVQFGNYVEQGRRQSDLNEAFDGLMDMAAVLGVPPRALSLDGKLGLAFGARGKGGKNAPAAHYEPDNVVINLTKGGGPGSLAHEWWHSLDNYFGKESGAGGYGTGNTLGDKTRAAMKVAFDHVKAATQVKTLRQRAKELDKRKSKPYWDTPIELSARSFESYVIAKLQDQNAANDYLANVVSKEAWDVSEGMRAEFFGDKMEQTYPYPSLDELPAVRAAFDDFFQTVETRETDSGTAMFSIADNDNALGAADEDRKGFWARLDRLRDGLAAARIGDEIVRPGGLRVGRYAGTQPASIATGVEQVAFEDRVAGFDGVVSFASAFKAKDGKSVFRMYVMPMELVQEATIEQLQSAGFREEASVVKVTLIGTQEDGFNLAVEAPMRGDIAYERAEPGSITSTGQKDSRGREYQRLNIGQRATREYLTEAVRRFGLHYGYAPTVTFNRDTGANPGEGVRSVSADEVQSKFDMAGLDRSDAKADTAPYEPAGNRHTELVARIAARINRNRPAAQRYMLDAVAVRPGSTGARSRELAAVTSVAKRFFGHEVVFVKFGGKPLFNGMVDHGIPGVVFVNADSQRPMMAVLGHELLHKLRNNNPELYRDFVRRISRVTKNAPDYAFDLEKKYDAANFPMPDDWVEELHADMVGDFFTDPQFWQEMAADQPGLFKRLANAILKFLDDVAEHLKGNRTFGTDRYLTDINAARAAVVSAMRDYSTAQNKDMADEVEGIRLSVGDSPDAWMYRFWGSRDWASEDEARDIIRRRIVEDNERYAGMFKPNDPALVDGLIFTKAPKGRFKLKQPKQPPAPFARIGEPADSEGTDRPRVDWESKDLADDGTPDSVLQAYGRGKGNIYRAWVDPSRIPPPKGEGIDKAGYPVDESGYDWTELSSRGSPPPLKLRVGANGKIVLMDGNHRLAWWRDKHAEVPAYVIDERKGSDAVQFSIADTLQDTTPERAVRTAQDLVNTKGGVFDFNRLGETKQDRLRTVMDGSRPFWLGALTRDQIADIYGKEIAPVKDYDELTRAMENERSKMAGDADTLYTEWAKLDQKDNDRLARIMLDGTVHQVHPDRAFEPNPGGENEDERRRVHGMISTQYKLLPPEAKAMYGKVRDFHLDTLTKLRDALEARIERQVEGGNAKAAALTSIRTMFDKYLGSGPYFPLSRFGDFLVVAKRDDGERVVASYATAGEQQAAARKLESDGFTVKMKTTKTYSRETDGAAGKFIGDVLTAVDKLDMDDATVGGQAADLKNKLLDDINQMFIKALPDLSYRKHFMHRKGTPGFSSDVMRGFASSAFHAASHIARLNHGDKMTFALQDAYTQIEQAPDGDFNQASQVLNELTKRHDAAMNPNTHPIAAMLNQVGFIMYLGLSPAAGLVNMLQTVMVTMPHLGARYGFGKANGSLATAYADILAAPVNAKNGWNAAQSQKLTQTERAMMSQLQDEGVIDLTQAHDLASATNLDTGNVARSKAAFAMSRAMKIVGWTFHIPEVMNRQVTALSAYRLEMEKSGDEDAAKDAAREAIKRTHFDYSASNRARFMSGNLARVVTQFKQYSQNMTYLLGRAAHQALKGESPEVRAIARRQLVATLGVTFGMAGALGLPGLGSVMGLIGLLAGAMDDDDEPWDWKVEFRNLMADNFGKEAGEVIAHGIPRALMPWDISSRVGLGDLWWRDSGREGQNPREAFAADMQNILGPTAGTLMGLYTAADHMARGNWSKATESIVPKALRDPLKAIREANEGMTNYNGEPLMDVDAAEVAGRALGFAPARGSEMFEARNAVKNAETVLNEKRQRLLSRMVKARMDLDTVSIVDLQDDINEFNQRNPEFRITSDSIMKSVRAKRRNAAETEDGIRLPKGKQSLRELGRFAEVD